MAEHKKKEWRAKAILNKKLSMPRLLLSTMFAAAQTDTDIMLGFLDELEKGAANPAAISQDIEHALLALKTGKLSKKPELAHPETQYVWAVIFAVLQKDPSLTQSWPKALQPPEKAKTPQEKLKWMTNSPLWQQFVGGLRMKQELLLYAANAVDATGDRDVRVRWGAPGTGIRFIRNRNLLSIDLQLALTLGFEHTQGLALLEISRGALSREYPQAMQDLQKEIRPLKAKQVERKNKLSADDYKKLRLKAKEWQLRNRFYEMAEQTALRHYVEQSFSIGYQDYSYDFNVAGVIKSMHGGFYEPEKLQGLPASAQNRFINLCRAMDLVWLQQNGLFEDQDIEWEKMGVRKDWIKVSKAYAGKVPANMSGFDYLRHRLIDKSEGLKNLVPDESERMMGDGHYDLLIEESNDARNQAIGELWDIFVEDLLQELLIEEEQKIDEEIKQQQEQDKNQESQDQDGDGEQGEGQEGEGQEGDGQESDGQESNNGSGQKGKKQKPDKNQDQKKDQKPEKSDDQQGEDQQGEPDADSDGNGQQQDKQDGEKGQEKQNGQDGEKQEQNEEGDADSEGQGKEAEDARNAQQEQEARETDPQTDDDVDVDDVGKMKDVDAGSETPDEQAAKEAGMDGQSAEDGKDGQDNQGQDSDGESADDDIDDGMDSDSDSADGESADGENADDDGQTMDEIMEDMQEQGDDDGEAADGDEADGENADADGEKADGEGADGQAQQGQGTGKAKAKSKKKSRQGGSSNGDWKDKIDEGWEDYSRKLGELSGPITQVAKILKKIRDKQIETKIARSKEHDIFPPDGDADRLNFEKHRDFKIKQLSGQKIDQKDLDRFAIDRRKSIPTTVDFVILIDGSGSMVGKYAGNTTALGAALTACLILQEAAEKIGGFNVYVGMWGGNQVKWVKTPDMKRNEVAANYAKAKEGLHSGTDLSPALDQTVDLLLKRPVKTGQRLGRTHVVVLSDGDLNHSDATPSTQKLQKWLEASKETTVDFAIISHSAITHMDRVAQALQSPRRTQKVGTVRTNKPEQLPLELIRMLANKVAVGKSFMAVTAKEKKRGLRRSQERMKKIKGGGGGWSGYMPP